MTIDVNKIVEYAPESFSGFQKNGYRQISPELGIKTFGNHWCKPCDTIAELRASQGWTRAVHEYECQKKAAAAGLAPNVYSVTTTYTGLGQFVPCITMDHIPGITLYSAVYMDCFIERDMACEILLDLCMSLADIGYHHNDIHGENVLLEFDYESNQIVRKMFIDFEYAKPMSEMAWPKEHWLSYFIEDIEGLFNEYDKFGL